VHELTHLGLLHQTVTRREEDVLVFFFEIALVNIFLVAAILPYMTS
jgi:hypothetical protein